MSLGQQQGFEQKIVLILLISAVLGFLLFLAIENRHKQPMLKLSLFPNLRFSFGLITGCLVFQYVVYISNCVFNYFFWLLAASEYRRGLLW